jgi:hypothetical protein
MCIIKVEPFFVNILNHYSVVNMQFNYVIWCKLLFFRGGGDNIRFRLVIK